MGPSTDPPTRPDPASRLRTALQVAALWIVATGVQVPGLVALLRFVPDPQAIRTAEGPAWGPRQVKNDRSLTLQPGQGGSLGFLCAPPACSSGGVVNGVAARVTWIVAPVREFGGDALVPLKIEQRGKTLFESTAEDMVARELRLSRIDLGLTQGLFVACGLLALCNRRSVRARRAALSREAATRRQAR